MCALCEMASAKLLLVLVLTTGTLTAAVNYIYDEFLFTKDTWQAWKLENPLQDINPTDETPQLKQGLKGLESAQANSLDGPFARRVNPPPRE